MVGHEELPPNTSANIRDLVLMIKAMLRSYHGSFLRELGPEAQSTLRLLWMPFDLFMSVLNADTVTDVMINEHLIQSVSTVSISAGRPRIRRADLAIVLAVVSNTEAALLENSLSKDSEARQLSHTREDNLKLRKCAMASWAVTGDESPQKVIVAQLGRSDDVEGGWFFDWAHAEAVPTTLTDNTSGKVFVIKAHKGARCDLKSVPGHRPSEVMARSPECRESLRRHLLSVLDCCLHAVAYTQLSEPRSTRTQQDALISVQPTPCKPSSAVRGETAAAPSGGAPAAPASSSSAVGSGKPVVDQFGLAVSRPWAPTRSLPLLIGPTYQAALGAVGLKAGPMFDGASRSLVLRVFGGPGQPERVLKMADTDSARLLMAEEVALQRLAGVWCAVQPKAWLECAKFAGGMLLPLHRPYPVDRLAGNSAQFVAFLELAVRAIADLHQHGVAHGDLKPDVFRVGTVAAPAVVSATAAALPRLVLIDFNLSLQAAEAPDMSAGCWGTPPFCLFEWSPKKAAQLDCVALSSLLAHWLAFPSSVGGPGCHMDCAFSARQACVSVLVDEWSRLPAACAPAAHAWHFKVLLLQQRLLERSHIEPLAAIWASWYYECWRNETGSGADSTFPCWRPAEAEPAQSKERAAQVPLDLCFLARL